MDKYLLKPARKPENGAEDLTAAAEKDPVAIGGGNSVEMMPTDMAKPGNESGPNPPSMSTEVLDEPATNAPEQVAAGGESLASEAQRDSTTGNQEEIVDVVGNATEALGDSVANVGDENTEVVSNPAEASEHSAVHTVEEFDANILGNPAGRGDSMADSGVAPGANIVNNPVNGSGDITTGSGDGSANDEDRPMEGVVHGTNRETSKKRAAENSLEVLMDTAKKRHSDAQKKPTSPASKQHTIPKKPVPYYHMHPESTGYAPLLESILEYEKKRAERRMSSKRGIGHTDTGAASNTTGMALNPDADAVLEAEAGPAGEIDHAPVTNTNAAGSSKLVPTADKTQQDGKTLKLTVYVGDLFAAPENSVLIHACNTQGSWGAGIAAAFRTRYPEACKVYRAYCTQQHDPRRNPVRTGTCLLIPPCETKPGAKKHWIGCLFTSAKYGAAKDKPSAIVRNSVASMAHLLKRVQEEEASGQQITSLWMCKINSGKFGVPWNRTVSALTTLVLEEGWRDEVEIWDIA